MKEYFSFSWGLALLLALCAAITMAAQDDVIPEGTRLNLQVNENLSTSANKEGDTFTAVVTKPVYLGDRIVIPKGSVVHGSTARILRPSKYKGATLLKLSFQSIDIPGRGKMPITATLVGKDAKISGEIRSEGFIERSESKGRKVGIALGSGLAGAGVGAGIGGRKGASIGAGIGTVVGIGLASTIIGNGDNIEIPLGSMLIIEFDQPLKIPQERATTAIRNR